jgi:agmatine deiminase
MFELIALVLLTSAAIEPVQVSDIRAWESPVPEGMTLPRSMTDSEFAALASGEVRLLAGGTPPPTGPVRCASEYEAMSGIVVAWEGSSSLQTILAMMGGQITTNGDADYYVVLDSSSEESSASAKLASYGTDLSRVHFVIRSTDSIWLRDYGPRYIFEGECRAIIDHTYNRPRPQDNAFNIGMAAYMNHACYEVPLVHGGGNYHCNSTGEGHATELILNENSSLSQTQIVEHWRDYQNIETTIEDAFPTSIDSTQHIDMWMQIVDEATIIISDWPTQSGTTQDQICDAAASAFLARGWEVFRTPAVHSGGTHYTYTNMVICNDVVLLPLYTSSSVSGYNTPALEAVRSAMPDHQVVQINCQAIVGYAGVMHCICMHVPRPFNGTAPAVYMKTLRGGESLRGGDPTSSRWISDDDNGVISIDILFSSDSGQTFTEIETGVDDDGYESWTVPDIGTTHGRVRLVAYDADGQIGTDESDTDITVLGSSIPGDANGDGLVDVADVLAVLSAWGACPDPDECPCDFDGNGAVGVGDMLIVLAHWT